MTRLRGAELALTAWLISCISATPALADPRPVSDRRGFAPAYSLEAVYTADLWHNTRGGLRKGDVYLDNLDINLRVDGLGSSAMDGLTAYAHLIYNNGETFSDVFVGDAMVVSNIDSSAPARVHEAWIEWATGHVESLAFRVGLYDLNTEFDTSDNRSLFLHSTHGVGHELAQSGKNGPSIFPNTSLGMRVAWDAGGNWRLLGAVLDGVPGDRDEPARAGVHLSSEDGALGIVEAQWSRGRIENLVVGHWRYTAAFADLLSTGMSPLPDRHDNHGSYGAIDIALNNSDAEWGSSAFFRFGVAEGRINEYDQFLGMGLRFNGLIPGRSDDQVGIAFSRAGLSRAALHAAANLALPRDNFEAAIELTWRAVLNDWLTMQPDVQYVINPGASPALDDALAVGLRIELAM
jgi:porin